jgi:hypothetical protein
MKDKIRHNGKRNNDNIWNYNTVFLHEGMTKKGPVNIIQEGRHVFVILFPSE